MRRRLGVLAAGYQATFLKASRRRRDHRLCRRDRRGEVQLDRLVARTSDALDRWTVADRQRYTCSDARDGDGRCGDGRPGLDPHLRAQGRLSSGYSFIEALLGADPSCGVCRIRQLHGAADPRRRTNPAVSQRGLFSAGRASQAAAAGVADTRCSHRQPQRPRPRRIPVHARDRSSPLRRAGSSVCRLPRGNAMTSPYLWTLIAIQIAMGAFDTFYHHEMTERLAWRPSQRRELQLNSVRNALYALLFLTLGWLEVHGIWAMLVITVLVVEVVVTLMDFVEEDMSRKLPASERINHTLLVLNYGAILVLLLPVLIEWAARPSAFQSADHGPWSILATISAIGVGICGVRDFAPSKRLARLHSAPVARLAIGLPRRPTILVPAATGFIGSRLVAGLTAAAHQVIPLVINPAKA